MKAIRIHAHAKTSDVLHYEDAPKPSPKKGELLVKVYAASVIPGDWKTRNGRFGDQSANMPFVMGYDVSGVVESVGEGVEEFKPGEEVFAYLPNGGSFAEYATGPENVFARKPKNITHEQAAGVPVSGLAAWHALVEVAELKEGQTVLIHGGAGGVGHFGVQIAHSIGARVITTASPRNHEFLKSIGADLVIDYNTQKFEDIVSNVDVVFDMIGGDVQERSYQVLKPGGYLVAINQRPSPEKLAEHNVRGSFLATPPDGKFLAKLAKKIELGEVVPHVSKSFPLSETAAAMDLNEKGHTRGKIAIKVR